MKFTLTLAVGLCTLLSSFGQTTTHSVNRYSKVKNDTKFIVTEYTFEDGHIENYVTSVPVAELRKLKVKNPLTKKLKNIEWDENSTLEGLQLSLSSIDAIENAFNNAINKTEMQLQLTAGSLGKVVLDDDFLQLDEASQSYILINSIVEALSSTEIFSDLTLIDGVDKNICSNSKVLAGELLDGQADEKSSAMLIGYRNIEFSEHLQNEGIFLSNGEQDLSLTNVRSIYNWVFADQYTGWHNRNLILNRAKVDDVNEVGSEGFMGIGSKKGNMVDGIVDNPTMKKSTSVVFQVVDPVKDSKYAFDLMDVKPVLTAMNP